ncbi:Dehydrogenases with different specificities (related to short-chain alcohol dehydrogenases) [Phaffia rhodozyma]|uniref:Dehydrogenases with different specificities (Related to short-chain alcohol dehydrogenases) n=1 Tax=Phaffia rhodozyma TaxID=264483 RepID=A0A0F7SQ04_PHARH|nr:short chain dehydrogenase reductase SDR [Phaffia rhodozyma]CED82193.1 Dehydrogenases with different specificities (related to short-chain alcohol dehydrogenases) [Phaffia rhodozyma]
MDYTKYTSTILITGGTTGLGEATAYALARANTERSSRTVIVICSRSNGQVADEINKLTGQTDVVYIRLDLSTKQGTKSFVDEYLSQGFPPISCLILNAAIQFVDKVHISPDGYEEMFAVNHLNQAYLFFLLRSQLTTSARIVLIASSTHDPKLKRVPPPNYTTAEAAAHPPTDPALDTQPEGFRRYALSKLCNVLFAYALHHHAQSEGHVGWTVVALDPGVMSTKLYRWAAGIQGVIFRFFLSNPFSRWWFPDFFPVEKVADSVTKLATDQDVGTSGRYYQVIDVKEIESSEQSHDKALQEDLWIWTKKELGIDDPL